MSTTSPEASPVGPNAAGGGRWPRRRTRLIALAIVAVIAAAAALAATDPFSSPASSGTSIDNAYPISTTTIEQKTITEQTDVSATLGYSGSDTVTLPSGTGAGAVATDEATVAADKHKLSADESSLSQAKALALTSGSATLRADRSAVANDITTLKVARTQLAEDENLGCPSASSSTVTTAASDSSASPGDSGSSSTGSSAPGSKTGTGGDETGEQVPGVALGSLDSGTGTTTAPSATTSSANALTPTSETLTGSVDPGGLATSYYFRYGSTSALSQATAPYTLSADAGMSPVSIDVTGLAPDATYEYELVATNSLGSSSGEVEIFASSESSCAAQRTVITEDTQALSSARDALAADKTTASSSVATDEQTVTADEATLAADEATLGQDRSSDQGPPATFTTLPSPGANLTRGMSVYSLNDEPVPLFYGAATMYRALFAGERGPDVKVLQENLLALGYAFGLSANGVFGASTTAAVRAWQAAIGVPVTGQVDLGAFVVAPGPLRVTSVTATDGSLAQAGGAVLAASSTAKVVTIALDANLEGEVKVGDNVSVTLPSGATTPGVVSSVGTVATAGSGTGSTPTVSVLVSLTDPSAAGDLDDASVEVAVTTGSAPNAIVVPVDALLALASGGYALEEVASNGTHHLVGVTTGIFDDAAGLVSVTGTSIAAGQKIVIPAL